MRFGDSLSFKESEDPCSLLTLEPICSEGAPSFAATLTSCKKKKRQAKVSFVGVPEMPCDAATTASLPATPRSSPLRKRRKFQRRNSKTPSMLFASVTEFQTQVYQHDSNLQFDESMMLAEVLFASMLKMDHNKAAAVVPSASTGSFHHIVPGCAPANGSRRGIL